MKLKRKQDYFFGLIIFALLALFFQNCGESTRFKDRSEKPPQVEVAASGTGHGYDGKLFAHRKRGQVCNDGSIVLDLISVSQGSAHLLKSNCVTINPTLIPADLWRLDADELIYNDRVFELDPCQASPAPPVGSVCLTGAIYAGVFNYGGQDGRLRVMTTPGNCTSGSLPSCDGDLDSLQFEWGDLNLLTGLSDEKDGIGNTQALDGVLLTHPSAQYCSELEFAGYDDWYLPAVDELNHLLTEVRDSIGGMRPSPAFYWSSSEAEMDRAVARSVGSKSQLLKSERHYVRCMRRIID